MFTAKKMVQIYFSKEGGQSGLQMQVLFNYMFFLGP